jgi:hypothetical protein
MDVLHEVLEAGQGEKRIRHSQDVHFPGFRNLINPEEALGGLDDAEGKGQGGLKKDRMVHGGVLLA